MYLSLDDNIVTLPLLLPQETTFEHRQTGLHGLEIQALTSYLQDDEKSLGIERVAWGQVSVSSRYSSRLSKELTLKLNCGIFRAYQAITECEFHGSSPAYTCAVEERATFYLSAQNCGL
jgi:hypothetical protein